MKKAINIIGTIIFYVGYIPIWIMCEVLSGIAWFWTTILQPFSIQAGLRRKMIHDAFDFGYDWEP